jgi:hypothetical protein
MKNLSLAMDELAEAESRALQAAKWMRMEIHGNPYWKKNPTGNPYTQDEAIYELKGTWEARLV